MTEESTKGIRERKSQAEDVGEIRLVGIRNTSKNVRMVEGSNGGL